ncbi:Protein priA [Grifola frondosa]|uniref:Protein priA n=1 Tax=Grifola frondosa TaxID=5627 RepID=A0A1C7MKB1_GRIFR|nr:Protein priA [Grifola frondosa]
MMVTNYTMTYASNRVGVLTIFFIMFFQSGDFTDPHSHQRRSNARVRKHSRVTTLAGAQSTCNSYETVCGVYGGGPYGFECLDVDSELESCGGCIIPNPFSLASNLRVSGRDCTTISGVHDVSCVAGRCMVQSCAIGWTINTDGEGCTNFAFDEVAASLDPEAQHLRIQSMRRSHLNVPNSGTDKTTKSDFVRLPDIRSDHLEADFIHIPDIRSDKRADSNPIHTPDIQSHKAADVLYIRSEEKHISSDFIRLPDIRSF